MGHSFDAIQNECRTISIFSKCQTKKWRLFCANRFFGMRQKCAREFEPQIQNRRVGAVRTTFKHVVFICFCIFYFSLLLFHSNEVIAFDFRATCLLTGRVERYSNNIYLSKSADPTNRINTQFMRAALRMCVRGAQLS
jgi:hypothetical protein